MSLRRAPWWILGLGVMLAGCDSAQVQDCEGQLLARLKSPSSYKRIDVGTMRLDAGKPPPYFAVEIKYDAVNSFNAPIRDTERCSYRIDDKGRVTTKRFDPYSAIKNDSAKAADDAVEEALEGADGLSALPNSF